MSFDRHLSYIDSFALDQVQLVYVAQTPGLNELIRELTMEEHTTFLNAP